jgi:hypothetical protein
MMRGMDEGPDGQVAATDQSVVALPEPGQNDLVEVPPASSAEELERLAKLAEGLSPEQIEELNKEIIMMSKPTSMDIHLGWNLEQVAEVFQTALDGVTSGQTIPEFNFNPEDLTMQSVHQLKQQLRALERNDDTASIAVLKDTSLAERVTLTIMKERPDLSLAEVYNNAVEVTTILRTRCQREIEQAYRERHLRERLAIRPVLEGDEQVQMVVSADKWDLSKIPPPKDEEYLVDDPPVVNYVMKSMFPEEWKDLTPHQRELEKRNVTRRASKFEQIGGKLFRVKRPKGKPNQLPATPTYHQVLSGPQKEAILRQIHDLNGHPSQNQSARLISERFWWKNITKEIREYVKTCHVCQMANQPTTARSDGRTLVPTKVDRPFEMIGLDLAGPLPETEDGNQYLIIGTDYYTGWSEVGLAKSTDAKAVCDFIHKEINCRDGTPAVIVLDNDAAKGDVKTKCAEWGISLKRILPYAAFSNGLAEAMVKQYKKGLRKLV